MSELIIAGFFAEHSIPFPHAERFGAMCKMTFPGSEIAKNVAMKQSEMTHVARDGIVFHEKLTLNDICKKHENFYCYGQKYRYIGNPNCCSSGSSFQH